MGQSVYSKNNYYGSTIFGYITATNNEDGEKKGKYQLDTTDDDNVLFKPFLYGLELSGVNSTTCDNSYYKNDSGFLLSEKNSQLWNDLTYIDQTYYNNNHQLVLSVATAVAATATTTVITTTEQVDNNIFGHAISFNDITLMCQSSSMQDIDLSQRGLRLISKNIGLLHMIRKLDLSCNYLKELPQEIGYLKQLEYLSVSNNQIKIIPDSICHLSHLTEFNISNNQLKELTPFIRFLSKLQTLNISCNQLKEIPVIIVSASTINDICNSLTLLDLSYNPISILPAEITQLPFLRRLLLDGCLLTDSLDHFQLSYNPPSLLEICARSIIKKSVINQQHNNNSTTTISLLKSTLTESLYEYISNYKVCSHCYGPYFDSYVSRGRWIERNDIWIPLEYRLCSAHWSDESDRILSMFASTNIATTTTLRPLPCLSLLSSQPSSTIKTRRSRFSRKRRLSTATSVTITAEDGLLSTPVVMEEITPLLLSVAMTAVEDHPHQQHQPVILSSSASQQLPENLSFSSTVKRWKYKVRNNSSLFLKNHGLY